jgi:uncharacterized membrane protein
MKILGHPVHIMLIHFPSALLPMDLICSLFAYYTGNLFFTHAAYLAMAGGVGLGALAIITGTFDLISVAENKPLALKKALIHGGINSTVIIAYSLFLFQAYKRYPELVHDTVAVLIVKGSLVTFMLLGNYIGGSLVLKDGVGLEKN